MFPWDGENLPKVAGSKGSRSKKAGTGGPLAASAPLPKAQQKKRGLRSAAGWASAQARIAGKKTTLPTGGSALPVTTIVSPPAPPQMPQLVNGKTPTNDKGYLLQLGSQAGFRGRWYCGRILDPADLPGASDQCGPEGGPQCDACARFQATYEPDLNDDGFPVKRSSSVTHCYYFYCGRPGVVIGSAGTCGPQEGPQCPSCQRLQESFKACHVNDEGCMVLRGITEGYKGKFYCGRLLGVKAIPGSDGRCGPKDGPQCKACQRFQESQKIVIDEEPASAAQAIAHTSNLGVISAPAEASRTASATPVADTEIKVKLEKQETVHSTEASLSSTQAKPISDKPMQQSRTIQRSGASSEAIATEINDEGCALTFGTEEGFRERYYCGRKLGMAAIPDSSDGRCGPTMGPQCGSCQRFQRSKEVNKNDEGALVRLGTEHGFRNTYFCGRGFLDSHSGAAFRCGPDLGPQCGSCRRFQMSRSSGSSEPRNAPAGIKQEQNPGTESGPSAARRVEKTSKQPASTGRAARKHTPSTSSRKLVDSGDDADLQQIQEETVAAEKTRKQPAQRGNAQSVPKASPQQTTPAEQAQPRILCTECGQGDREAELLLCDGVDCGRATHLSCCKPKMKTIPEGNWFCNICTPPRTPKARKHVDAAHGLQSRKPAQTPQPSPAEPMLLCTACNLGDRTQELLLCDAPGCGRATHLTCCRPKLKVIPKGDWFCNKCAPPQASRKRASPMVSPVAAINQGGDLMCSECRQGDRAAELLLCDTPGCPIATHYACCRPPFTSCPDGEWFCAICDPPTPKAKKRKTARGTDAAKGVGKGGVGKGAEIEVSFGAAIRAALSDGTNID